MRYCIRLLRSVCSHGDEGVLSDLSDQNAIGELVGRGDIILPFCLLCWGKATVAYTMPQQRKKEECERLRGGK